MFYTFGPEQPFAYLELAQQLLSDASTSSTARSKHRYLAPGVRRVIATSANQVASGLSGVSS